MTQKQIEFYWDCASPYTYLAATQIGKLAAEHATEIIWKPMLLGVVLKAAGNQPPAMIPHKGRYLFHDLQDWAELYGVPVTPPKSFPLNSVHVARAFLAATAQGANPEQAALGLMHRHWGLGLDVNQPDVLAEWVAALNLEMNTLQSLSQTDEIKNQLRQFTDEAVQRKVFGAPTFFVGTKMFWGNDRLPLLARYLDKIS